jgi:hypothetical protein
MPVRPSLHEENIPFSQFQAPDLGDEFIGAPDCLGEDVPGPGWDLSGSNPLLCQDRREVVVGGNLEKLSAPEEVDTAVSDVADPGRTSPQQDDIEGGSHTLEARLLDSPPGHCRMGIGEGLGQQELNPLLAGVADPLREETVGRSDRKGARHIPSRLPPHTIGQEKDLPFDVGKDEVLVAAAYLPDVALPGRFHVSALL